MNVLALILAAGEGKRMQSERPKVLQYLANEFIIEPILQNLNALALRTAIIYGHQGQILQNALMEKYPHLLWIEQAQRLGTGHAVLQALPHIEDGERVLIMLGDMPLLRRETLEILLQRSASADLFLLTAQVAQPQGYGRIVRNEGGEILAIVEEKDADAEQKKIAEINSGVMVVSGKHLKHYLPQLKNDNAQGEYYLTDLIALMRADGLSIEALCLPHADEIQGINDRAQLAQAEAILRRRRAEALLAAGACLIDPERIDIQGEMDIGRDVLIEPNVLFRGQNRLGDGVRIEAHCVIIDSVIEDGATILSHSRLEGCHIGAGAQIGPFARLRPDTRLAANCRVGNFVEIKASNIEYGSKINHLSYIGDAHIGAKVNVGAGCITCNYDGAAKHRTEIGDGVFIGSNSALVAPLRIGDHATIGAGSTIREDVPAQSLSLTRGEKHEKIPWQRPQKKEST